MIDSSYWRGLCPVAVPLSRYRERILFSRVRRKVPGAFDAAVLQYLGWAAKLATTAHGKTALSGARLAQDEAVSAANSGLVEAVLGYDSRVGLRTGARFTTYAFPIIRRHLIEALIATYPVRLSEYARENMVLEDGQDSILDQTFPALSGPELLKLAEASERPTDAHFMSDTPGDPSASGDREILREDVRQFLATLDPLEREALMCRYYREPVESFRAAALRLGIQRDAVRDAHDLALQKLKRHFAVETKPLAA